MTLTIGQLATLTGLTVRALHHYDAIGLLTPSHRSEAGYRLYVEADIVRLFRIQALRRLGLPLSDIALALTGNGAALPDVLAKQIDEVDAAIAHASALRARLTRLQEVLAAGDAPASEDWLGALELVTQYDRYCSGPELSKLLAHHRASADEWPRLIAEIRSAIGRGVAAESAEAQALGSRWRRLMLNQVGGDMALAIKIKLAYNDRPELQARAQAQTGLDPAILAFLSDVWRHGHVALWARHLSAEALTRISVPDERMRDWIRLVGEIREAVNERVAPNGVTAQRLLANWDAILDTCAEGDSTLRAQIDSALAGDAELQTTWGLDADVLAFVEALRRASHAGVAHA